MVFTVSYLFFHFVTDEGIALVWHAEVGKAFVTFMVATPGVLFFGAVMSLLIAFISAKKTKITVELKQKIYYNIKRPQGKCSPKKGGDI